MDASKSKMRKPYYLTVVGVINAQKPGVAPPNTNLAVDENLSRILPILNANDPFHEKNVTRMSELELFMRMLEWMEIEGAIIKAYKDLSKSPHRGFRKAELKTVDKALEETDRIVHSLMSGFFKERNFACGVLNSLLVTYVFAAYRGHIWLLYLVEGLFLLPRNLYQRIKAKPLNRLFSYLDFCWMCNTFALGALVWLVLHKLVGLPLPPKARRELYIWTMGVSSGPLLGAAIAFPFVALQFHDIDTITGLFIHIFPPMVAYSLRWNTDAIRKAWPGVFLLNYLEDVTYFGPDSVARNALRIYLVWFVFYSMWMLCCGIDMPRSDRVDENSKHLTPKYDTVFHIAMRGGACLLIGKKYRGRSVEKSLEQMKTNHFDRTDLFIYLATHACLCLFSTLVLGYACFHSKRFHGAMLLTVVLLAVRRGAKRYSYYTTHMYSVMLRKHFHVLARLNDIKNDQAF